MSFLRTSKVVKKTAILVTILATALGTFSQNNDIPDDYTWGVGFHLGDPSGITAKKNLEKGKFFEIILGRTHFFSSSKYYSTRFDDWYDGKNYNYEDFEYVSYSSSTPIGIQAHYLRAFNLMDDVMDGLYWYGGGGAQVRVQTHTYAYKYKLDNTGWIYEDGATDLDMDFGLDGVVGVCEDQEREGSHEI